MPEWTVERFESAMQDSIFLQRIEIRESHQTRDKLWRGIGGSVLCDRKVIKDESLHKQLQAA
jgi:hypothetical protein